MAKIQETESKIWKSHSSSISSLPAPPWHTYHTPTYTSWWARIYKCSHTLVLRQERERGTAGIGIPWDYRIYPGITAFLGLRRLAYAFWQKFRRLLCQVALDKSVEHLSQACVPSSGTLSPSCIHKAFLEFNPFISLKCCSEFRLSKRQSLGSDGEKTGNYGALLLLQAGPELSTVQMFKMHTPDSVIYLAFCRLNLSLLWKSSP